ncbi:MAG: hypothetical protein C4584_02010 [Armatimonadetes bacterium]|nr:MAG: hypothetical protein C4584_02010 [Armatimonadota bacterium]
MDNEEIVPEINKKEIERPDITSPEQFENWLEKYVQKPFKGARDISPTSSERLSFEEALENTKRQLRETAEDLLEIGRPSEEIQEILMKTLENLEGESNPVEN